MIQGPELPREVERLGIGGRTGGNHPDLAGRDRDRGEHGDGFKPRTRGLRDIVAERELIGEEYRVEQRGFGALRQVLVVADVGQRQGRRRRMAPRRLMMASAVDEQVEMQLPLLTPSAPRIAGQYTGRPPPRLTLLCGCSSSRSRSSGCRRGSRRSHRARRTSYGAEQGGDDLDLAVLSLDHLDAAQRIVGGVERCRSSSRLSSRCSPSVVRRTS